MFKLSLLVACALGLCFALSDNAQAQQAQQVQQAQQRPAPRAKAARVQARAAPVPVPAPAVVLNRSDADLFAATLAGRFAQGTNNPTLAAQAWSRAFMRRPTDADLFQKAITSCLLAGDVATAVSLTKLAAPALRTDDAALALAADAFAQGRYGDVTRALEGRTFQPSLEVFADHLAGYALLGQGKRNEAVNMTSRATGIPAIDKGSLMSRAIILGAAGRRPEADILFQSAINGENWWPAGVRFYGDWLLGQGRQPEVVAMYQRLIRTGGSELASFEASLVKAQNNRPVQPNLDLRATAAVGLVTLAQSLAADGRGTAPLTLFNLIVHIDPRSDGASVALANQLITETRGDRAKPLLARVPATSADYIIARRELVWLVFGDDKAQALTLARQTVLAQPNDTSAQRLLADILAGNQNDAEAEALYSVLIDKSKTAGQSDDEAWPLYFGRGGARERQNNWPGALADLRLAKAAAPNQPSVLNYLGYAMADRGENIDEAIVMLRTAVRLRPRSGSILDSLGWALYRAGRFDEAVSTLETAASMAPASAEITDHLGDAYWRSGRPDEARMEWSRTLRLETTPLQKQTVTIKLRDGLPPDTATPAQRALASQDGAVTPR